jgi:hypothetical protein
MTVRIRLHSANITITARPTVNTPAPNGAVMDFTGTPVTANGSVILDGDAGDTAVGWSVGFLQAQWIETNWCFYRGQTNGDGSIFLQRARAPARPAQACRDTFTPVGQIFYDTTPGTAELVQGAATDTFPLTMNVSHFDQPSDNMNLIEQNGLTGKPNFLAEAQLEFFFCTVLTVRDPGNAFHHQCSFYWNQRWQATFTPTSFTPPTPTFRVHVLKEGTGSGVSHIILGQPTDKRFIGVLTSAQTQSCNQVVAAMLGGIGAGSANRHEAATWKNFDVRLA